MPAGTFLLLALHFGWAVAPYGLLFLAATEGREARPVPQRLLLGSVLGLAGFVAVSTPAAWVSFGLYRWLHVALGAVAAGAVVVRRAPLGPWPASELRRLDPAALAIVLLALGVRLVPLLVAGDSLGGNDARFHSILAHKIVVEDKLTPTWSPIVPVAVVYPRGVHLLSAFMARGAGTPVHQAFNALFPIVGALTAGLLYLLGKAAFESRGAGLLSAASYALLARWGSLDYFRWGGLPNAVGMLLLCLVVWVVLCALLPAPDRTAVRWAWAGCGGVGIVAISLVHHYSFLVGLLVLVAGLLVAPGAELRRAVLAVGAAGTLLALAPIVTRYLLFAGEIGTTSVLVFREPPLTLWSCVRELNPAGVALFVVAMVAARGAGRTPRQVFSLSWFAALLAAFVFLEYVYRAGSLVWSGGRDCFTAFTPSRMATNLAYPMSLLSGALAVSGPWRRRPRPWVTLLGVAALASCLGVWREQSRVGVLPEVQEAGLWIRENTPGTSMVVGRLPHLAYLSWRESSHPPLPASEPRNHPEVTWRESMRGLPAWSEWSRRTGRPVYFVAPRGAGPPPPLPEVFSNSRVGVYALDPTTGGSP